MAVDFSLINNDQTDQSTQPHPMMTGLKDLGKGALYVAQHAGSGAARGVGGLADLATFGLLNVLHPLDVAAYGIANLGWGLQPRAQKMYDNIQRYQSMADSTENPNVREGVLNKLANAKDLFRKEYNITNDPGVFSKMVQYIPGYAEDPGKGLGHYIQRTGEFVPGIMAFGPSGLIPKIATTLASAASSLGADVVFPNSSLAQIAATTVGGGLAGGITSRMMPSLPKILDPKAAAANILTKTSPADVALLRRAMVNPRSAEVLQDTFEQMKPLAQGKYGAGLDSLAGKAKFSPTLADDLTASLGNTKVLPGTDADAALSRAGSIIETLRSPDMSDAQKFMGLDNFRRQIADDQHLRPLAKAINNTLDDASPGYIALKKEYAQSPVLQLPDDVTAIYENSLKRRDAGWNKIGSELALHQVTPNIGNATWMRSIFNYVKDNPAGLVDKLTDQSNIVSRHPYIASSLADQTILGAANSEQNAFKLEDQLAAAKELQNKSPLDPTLSSTAKGRLSADDIIRQVQDMKASRANPMDTQGLPQHTAMQVPAPVTPVLMSNPQSLQAQGDPRIIQNQTMPMNDKNEFTPFDDFLQSKMTANPSSIPVSNAPLKSSSLSPNFQGQQNQQRGLQLPSNVDKNAFMPFEDFLQMNQSQQPAPVKKAKVRPLTDKELANLKF